MRIARSLLDEIVGHALEQAPHECCGVVASRDGEAVRVIRVRNAAASALRFEMDPMEQYHAQQWIEDEGLDLGAMYHSHTRSAPVPSQTDVNLATRWWPDPIWVIVGVGDPRAPEVRAYRIRENRFDEVPLEVV